MRRLALLTFALVACSDERASPFTELVTWKVDVAPVLAERCASCHGGDAPSAGYDLTTYLGALGKGGDDVANAIAGDADSLLLAKLDGDALDDLHVMFADVAPLVRAWIVDSELAYENTRVHHPGLLDPASPGFHGVELRDASWDFGLCQNCHGGDFGGGAAERSCLGCHAKGPTACDTCHEEVPSTAAHRPHVERNAIACSECHRVPARWDDPGHILGGDGARDDAPAEVVLGALANRDLSPPRRTQPAAYDATTGACSNTYCHGTLLGDPAAALTEPTWTTGPAASACGSCHGAPPASHAAINTDCTTCHAATVAPGGTLAAGHLDGAIAFGNGTTGCDSCHGNATSAAPPRGLHGELVTTALAVGAHRAHLDAPSRLRGPLACAECHVVPSTIMAPGHIDSELPAEVFPAASGILARADGALPAWDRVSATCSGTYCHGGGTRLAQDTTPGIRAPAWTTSGQIFCGSCHGIPPSTAPHAPTMGIGDCTACHPSVDPFGNVILTGPPDAPTSQHLDGAVDVR